MGKYSNKQRQLAALLMLKRVERKLYDQIPFCEGRSNTPEHAAWTEVLRAQDRLLVEMCELGLCELRYLFVE